MITSKYRNEVLAFSKKGNRNLFLNNMFPTLYNAKKGLYYNFFCQVCRSSRFKHLLDPPFSVRIIWQQKWEGAVVFFCCLYVVILNPWAAIPSSTRTVRFRFIALSSARPITFYTFSRNTFPSIRYCNRFFC